MIPALVLLVTSFIQGGTPGIDVTWTASVQPPKVRGYRIYRKGPAQDAEFRNIAAGIQITSYTDLKVTAGKEYCYYVVAVNELGDLSQPSNTSCATP